MPLCMDDLSLSLPFWMQKWEFCGRGYNTEALISLGFILPVTTLLLLVFFGFICLCVGLFILSLVSLWHSLASLQRCWIGLGQVALIIQLASFGDSSFKLASNWPQVLGVLGQKWGLCIKPRLNMSFCDLLYEPRSVNFPSWISHNQTDCRMLGAIFC